MLCLRQDWSKKQIAVLGFSYGFGLMSLGVSWLVIAMTRYGGMPWPVAVLALAALAAYMSLFSAAVFATSAYLIRRWQSALPTTLLLVLPALWWVSEYLRGYLLTGFPWLSFGYAHQASPLAAYAPVLGVYGVGGLAALLAGVIALLLLQTSARRLALALAVTVLVGGAALRQIDWTQAHGAALTVRLAQTNIDQGEKFDQAFLNKILRDVDTVVQVHPADLIAIPETAIPLPIQYLPTDYLSRLRDFAQKNESAIFLGLVMEDEPGRYVNSVMGLRAASEPTAADYRYDKHHLVPFGEFVPWGFRWLVDMMKIPLGDQVSKSVHQAAMRVKDQQVMPNICYEDLFGDEIASQLRSQSANGGEAAHILLNMSNLAWYGESIAIPQHLQISQMRSLETGRPMLRSTNTGATAIINAKGQVQSQLDYRTQGSLSGTVQGMQGLTPYIRFGDLIAALLAAFALCLAWVLSMRKAKAAAI